MKKVFIIGAGVGGLSAAARLLQYGFDVEVFEKNNTIGGKTNFIKYKDFKFDLTSSIMMFPNNYIDIFEFCNEDFRNYFRCDGAMIFEFHNGGSNLSGLSFQHMSVTFERNALCEYPIANDFQKLALSLFPNLIKDLEETDCLYLNIEEKELEYQAFCKVLKKENIVDAVIIPIYGIEYPLGFILLGSKDPKVLQESDKTELHKQAQRISNLLDYKKHLLKK